MQEGEPGVVVRRMRMTKMGQGELGIAGTETVEDGDKQLERRAVILMGTLKKPGRMRQIRNPRKVMKRKMRKEVKVVKAKMRRNRTKSLIRKGKKRRPTRRKKTKRNQDLGNSVNYFLNINP